MADENEASNRRFFPILHSSDTKSRQHRSPPPLRIAMPQIQQHQQDKNSNKSTQNHTSHYQSTRPVRLSNLRSIRLTTQPPPRPPLRPTNTPNSSHIRPTPLYTLNTRPIRPDRHHLDAKNPTHPLWRPQKIPLVSPLASPRPT